MELISLRHSLFSSVLNLHHHFASRVVLKSLRGVRPDRPSSWALLSAPRHPTGCQKNLRRLASKMSMIFWGALYIEKKYVGIASSTDFNRVNLPPMGYVNLYKLTSMLYCCFASGNIDERAPTLKVSKIRITTWFHQSVSINQYLQGRYNIHLCYHTQSNKWNADVNL